MTRRRSALVPALRALLHLPYVRAIALALSLAAIAGSSAALTLALRHDVSAVAVARYFLRQHSELDSLGEALRTGSTVFHLEPLLALPPGVNPGGLVYEEEHGLVFYTHSPGARKERRRELEARRELFERLAPHYWRADLDALAREMNRPAMRQELLDRGARIRDLYAFQQYNGKPVERSARTELLRSAARSMQLVAPSLSEPMALGFVEQLRFYDQQRPKGRFVGRWELITPGPFAGIDAGYAHQMSEANHYIVISRLGEFTRVSTFFQGQRQDYMVRPIGHPSGQRSYRLTTQPAL